MSSHIKCVTTLLPSETLMSEKQQHYCFETIFKIGNMAKLRGKFVYLR